MNIKNGQLIMYKVDPIYRDFLRQYDSRVNEKNERKFYGILLNNNGIDYCIPFTSKKLKKTNPKLTINIKEKNQTIAKLLLNNMIPVNENVLSIVNINEEKDKKYYLKEIRYLRNEKVINEILNKTTDLFNIYNNPKHKDYNFFHSLCCNFPLLEEKCKLWNIIQDNIHTINDYYSDNFKNSILNDIEVIIYNSETNFELKEYVKTISENRAEYKKELDKLDYDKPLEDLEDVVDDVINRTLPSLNNDEEDDEK